MIKGKMLYLATTFTRHRNTRRAESPEEDSFTPGTSADSMADNAASRARQSLETAQVTKSRPSMGTHRLDTDQYFSSNIADESVVKNWEESGN